MNKQGEYTIKTDTGASIDDLLKLGKYDWSNDDIEKFPYEASQATAIEVVGFDESLSSEDVIKRLDENGLRPATATELLLLGAQHPELQRKDYIVALGTVQQVDGDRYVAYRDGSGAGRRLGLHWFGARVGSELSVCCRPQVALGYSEP